MRRTLWLVVSLSLALTAFAPLQAEVPPPGAAGREVTDPMQQLAQVGARVSYHAQTGRVRFIGAGPEGPISVHGLTPAAGPEQAARAFLGVYGELYGLADPAQELVVARTKVSDQGQSLVRFQQVYAGLPVFGGELVVHMDKNNNILSANGEILPGPQVDTTPAVGAEMARQQALETTARRYGLSVSALTATPPELWLYNPLLVGGPGPRLTTLVWRLQVQSIKFLPIRELVLVDARRGVIALHFNQIDAVKDRRVYDNQSHRSDALPGLGPVRVEGGPVSVVADVNNAYNYAGDTYNFYYNMHGRDSIDDAGLPLTSTVRYCPEDLTERCPYDNAFWNGRQMVYGEGYASADDVVAHEMTHGVTEHESNLFYYMQSGAINEAFSDLWGEAVDLTNGQGTDTPGVRWLIGEDLPAGPLRSMSDPWQYDHPDRMSSVLYYCGAKDNGGVHINNGVANKAAYLMVEGGVFNGKTVAGLGITKTVGLWYQVQNNAMLTSGSDYQDLYDALQQACANMVGTAGVTSADCQSVKNALDAVEMNQQPSGCAAAQAPVCPAGQAPASLFFDDLESGTSRWDSAAAQGSDEWYYENAYATSGAWHLYGADQADVADYYVYMKTDVPLPAGNTAYLRFNHAYDFEYSPTATYDGGVVEYSTDGGSTWSDAETLFTADGNGYNTTLFPGYSNPLGGRKAFGGESAGYIASRLNLATLAGQSVRFRFRIGTDSSNFDYYYGWFIDDVHVYTCLAMYPDVGISTHVAGSPFAPGAPITFTLAFTNSGDAPAAGVIITDDLPAEVVSPTFASTLAITPTGSFSYTWRVEPLEVGESGRITIYAQIDPHLASFSFVNTAAIFDPEDHTPANNAATAAVGPDVGLAKRALGSDLEPGDAITFTLAVSNGGNAIAGGVVVTDLLPINEVVSPTFASTLALTPTGSTGGLFYRWLVEPLAVGERGVITIYGQIAVSLSSSFSFVNTAIIWDPHDSTPGNNTSTATVSGKRPMYLPLVVRRYPPIPDTPTLNPISNPDGDGNYTVTWSPAYLADTYILQEDDNASFFSPITHSTGIQTSWTASNQAPGTYYYRVKASNTWGDSPWSAPQSVSVIPPERVPNDPSYSKQWGLSQVNAPQAWGRSTGAGIVIAVIDTGVDLNHPDLAGKILPGRDVVNGDNDPQDDVGHGTHVAGIAAAMTDNGAGVAGMGWDTLILPVKVLASDGFGTDVDAAQGIVWAVDNGANIVNMSLGGEDYSAALRTATDYAFAHGALVVSSAGNCGDPNDYGQCTRHNPIIYPAANPNVLAVGATTSSDERASFSEYGGFVDVTAPGVSIYSTFWNDMYRYLSGTSMASPLVAGLAALVWARDPALSNAQVADTIMSTAVDLGLAGRDDEYGYGRVNAEAAVIAASSLAVSRATPELAPPVAVSAPSATAPVQPGLVLVRFKPGTLAAERQGVLARLNLTVVGQIDKIGVLKVSVPAGRERDFAARLAADPSVEFAEPNYIVRLIP